jgi:hypothetical protein
MSKRNLTAAQEKIKRPNMILAQWVDAFSREYLNEQSAKI